MKVKTCLSGIMIPFGGEGQKQGKFSCEKGDFWKRFDLQITTSSDSHFHKKICKIMRCYNYKLAPKLISSSSSSLSLFLSTK